jgi:hypothetical protein
MFDREEGLIGKLCSRDISTSLPTTRKHAISRLSNVGNLFSRERYYFYIPCISIEG